MHDVIKCINKETVDFAPLETPALRVLVENNLDPPESLGTAGIFMALLPR